MSAAQKTLRAPEELPYRHVFGEKEPAHIEARRKLISSVPGFWRTLPKLQDGFDLVEDAREIGFGLHMLTKGPVSSANAWSEKLLWAQEHIPDAPVTVTMRKSLVYGRVLFDDYPPYFVEWLAVRKRGLVVCVAQAWNREYEVGGKLEHPNVIRYDGTNRAAVRVRLQAAYDRTGGEA
jgi:hypothetical protein